MEFFLNLYPINTKAVYKIVKLSLDEEDWATWNFMQWFVKEQTEEETLALNLLDKIKIAGQELPDNFIELFNLVLL